MFRLRYILKCLYFLFYDYIITQKIKSFNPKQKSVVIIHTDEIGDYVLFRNFIEQIKKSKNFENYSITLVANKIYENLAVNLDAQFVNEFIWIDKTLLKNSIQYRKSILTILAKSDFSVAINPSYSRDFIYGDSLIRAVKAEFKIGQIADLANGYALFRFISNLWYTKLIDTGKKIQFEFERNRYFIENIIEKSIELTAPIIEIITVNSFEHPYIVFFPGAGEIKRQWHIDNFAAVAKKLSENVPYKIIVCGIQSDYKLGEKIQNNCTENTVINLCGKTTLAELVNHIGHAKLLITNDSSALHIAASTQTKTICLSNGKHFGRFSPYTSKQFDFMVFLYPPKVVDLEKNNKEKLKKMALYNAVDSINNITVNQVFESSISLLNS